MTDLAGRDREGQCLTDIWLGQAGQGLNGYEQGKMESSLGYNKGTSVKRSRESTQEAV